MLVLRTVVVSLVVWCCAQPLQALQAQTATVESTAASKSTQVVTDRKDAIHLPTPKTEDAFQFIVYGDRTGGLPSGLEVLRQAVKDTNLFSPDLVMTVGDLVEGYNETPEWMQQMREFKGIMGSLDMAWYPVAGNHDIYWRGKGKSPVGQHEASYEKHFGPLWYSFEHKDCGFIVMYSDEGDPKTNKKSFHSPELQMVSETQLAFVQRSLTEFKDKTHVFVFLHHPRWTGGEYTGSNWDVVHQKFVAAGNVSAVFAGHIHHLRYDEKDGIEYHTLATTGGILNGNFPRAGYLHHFNVVTVRPKKISVAAVPVGAVMDPKQFTAEFLADFDRARALRPTAILPGLSLDPTGATTGVVEFKITNPCTKALDLTIFLDAGKDARQWQSPLGHRHFTLQPAEEKLVRLPLSRSPGNFDQLCLPTLQTQIEYMADSSRVQLDTIETVIPLSLDLDEAASNQTKAEKCLVVKDPLDALIIPDEQIHIADDSPLTLEASVCPFELTGHNGIVAKTQSSGYALFSREGVPEFSIHLGGGYVTVAASKRLTVGEWSHLAGVYDGTSVKLFVDGELVATKQAQGNRRANKLPLCIGADPDNKGKPTRPLKTMIDNVRLTPAAIYSVDYIANEELEPRQDSLLWLDFNESVGPFIVDRSQNKRRSILMGPNSKLTAAPEASVK